MSDDGEAAALPCGVGPHGGTGLDRGEAGVLGEHATGDVDGCLDCHRPLRSAADVGGPQRVRAPVDGTSPAALPSVIAGVASAEVVVADAVPLQIQAKSAHDDIAGDLADHPAL